MESFPVVLRCEDICVAVPMTILIKESTVFKSMFGIHESLIETTETKNDDQEWQIASYNGKNRGKNKQSGKQCVIVNTTDDNLDLINLTDRLSLDSCSRCKAKDAEVKNVSSRLQVDLIDIEGYSGESVKVLFEHLMGYNQLMEECTDLKVFADILMLCNSYDIKSPIDKVSKEIRSIEVDMESLLHAMEALEMFKHVDEYKNISTELRSRCIDLARWNFGSRPTITNFILENASECENELKMQLFEHLYYDSTDTVRYMVENVSKIKENNSIKTPMYILRNMPFNIEVSVFQPTEKLEEAHPKYFGFKLQSDDPEIYNYLTCKWKIFNRKHKNWEICTGGGLNHFIPLKDVLNEDNGYIKLDAVWIEAEINISPSSQNCLKLTECPEYYLCIQDIICNNWNLSNLVKKEDYPDLSTEPVKTGNPVILKCDDVMVAIDQSILIKKSSVFKRMFSNTWTSSEDDKADSIKDHEKTDNNRKLGRPKQQFEVIEITGFDPLAVRILFEQLKGYNDIFLYCPSIHLLGQLLMLCDFYAIVKPVKGIEMKIHMFPITTLNLLEAFVTAKSLEIVEAYKSIGLDLTERCVAFARCSLGTSSQIIHFMIKNKDNMDLSLQLFDYLGDKKEACFRYKVSLSPLSHFTKYHEATSPIYIFRNAEWTIHLTENWIFSQKKFLGVLLKCKPETTGWHCRFKMQIGLYNWKTGRVEYDPAKLNTFILGGSLMSGNKNFKYLDVIQDQNHGFIKNDDVLVEVKISVLDW